jgi:hypothetical protein
MAVYGHLNAQTFFPTWKEPRYPLGGPQSQSVSDGKQKNICRALNPCHPARNTRFRFIILDTQ